MLNSAHSGAELSDSYADSYGYADVGVVADAKNSDDTLPCADYGERCEIPKCCANEKHSCLVTHRRARGTPLEATCLRSCTTGVCQVLTSTRHASAGNRTYFAIAVVAALVTCLLRSLVSCQSGTQLTGVPVNGEVTRAQPTNQRKRTSVRASGYTLPPSEDETEQSALGRTDDQETLGVTGSPQKAP